MSATITRELAKPVMVVTPEKRPSRQYEGKVHQHNNNCYVEPEINTKEGEDCSSAITFVSSQSISVGGGGGDNNIGNTNMQLYNILIEKQKRSSNNRRRHHRSECGYPENCKVCAADVCGESEESSFYNWALTGADVLGYVMRPLSDLFEMKYCGDEPSCCTFGGRGTITKNRANKIGGTHIIDNDTHDDDNDDASNVIGACTLTNKNGEENVENSYDDVEVEHILVNGIHEAGHNGSSFSLLNHGNEKELNSFSTETLSFEKVAKSIEDEVDVQTDGRLGISPLLMLTTDGDNASRSRTKLEKMNDNSNGQGAKRLSQILMESNLFLTVEEKPPLPNIVSVGTNITMDETMVSTVELLECTTPKQTSVEAQILDTPTYYCSDDERIIRKEENVMTKIHRKINLIEQDITTPKKTNTTGKTRNISRKQQPPALPPNRITPTKPTMNSNTQKNKASNTDWKKQNQHKTIWNSSEKFKRAKIKRKERLRAINSIVSSS